MNDRFSNAEHTRREMLARMGTGLVLITLGPAQGQAQGPAQEPISPQQARDRGVDLRILTAAEQTTLEALGDVLLPGAAAAGIAHYIDDQLGKAAPLLMLKYVDYPGPFLDFYRLGLRSLEQLGRTRHGQPFHELTLAHKSELVREISQTNPPEWTGPPAPLFFFVTRNDAVDVYYGTQAGFAKLGVPYMAHILPQRDW